MASRELLRELGLPLKAALVLVPAWAVASLAGASGAGAFLLGFLAIIALMWLLFRIARRFLSRAIWRLRHRLLFAMLFISVIPLGLVIAFGAVGLRAAAGQLALYLVYERLDHQLDLLANWATAVARAETTGSSRLRAAIEEKYPGSQLTVSSSGTFTLGHGLTVRDGVLNGWATGIYNGRRVTILAPLARDFFDTLDPDLGRVSFLPVEGNIQLLRGGRFAPDVERASVGAVPPPVNALDMEIAWASVLALQNWDTGERSGTALLAVRTRLSSIFRRLVAPGVDSGNILVVSLAIIGILILIAEIVSIIIGITVTRTMTAAVHDLYEGTQRVMKGDFAHRIPVKGSEQIADLSRSFNAMTENVERLLKDSKEKERMHAELEIARSVQQQLFPTKMPAMQALEVHALCQPARQVSGDYYDCQPLGDGRFVIVLGDVAGKGISAALLMATLQSTLRIQIREWGPAASTERLVTGINQHLYLNTAPEKYATLFLAIYNQDTGELEYTNAGHLPPMLVRGGKASLLDVNGMVVGAFPNVPYESSKVRLEPGDLVVCYTDGVTELENEFAEQFGAERLCDVLLRVNGAGLDQVSSQILDVTRAFCGSPEAQDDLTMLLLRRTAA